MLGLCDDLGWVTSNATLRLGFYTWHLSSHEIFKKNFVVGIFGVWISGLLQEACHMSGMASTHIWEMQYVQLIP